MSDSPLALAALVAYLRTFATLIGAGVSLVRALAILGEMTDDPGLREANAAVKAEIEAGTTLSAAMMNHPAVYSRFLIGLVRAGEVGGVLDVTMERAAAYYERLLQYAEKLRLYQATARAVGEPVDAAFAQALRDTAETVALQHACYAFGTLLGFGVPILQAMQIVGTLLPERLAGWAEPARQALREGGESLVPLMAEWGFPAVILQLTALGEQAGQLDKTMITAADVLGYQVDCRHQQALQVG